MHCYWNDEFLSDNRVLEFPFAIKELPEPRHHVVCNFHLRLQFSFKHRVPFAITDHRYRALAERVDVDAESRPEIGRVNVECVIVHIGGSVLRIQESSLSRNAPQL